MRIACDNNLVPNFTISGFGMPPEIASMSKRYCGALVVSLYRSKYAENAIQVLLAAGVKTNIHYVLGENSKDEAIYRLKNNEFI